MAKSLPRIEGRTENQIVADTHQTPAYWVLSPRRLQRRYAPFSLDIRRGAMGAEGEFS